MAVTYDSFPAVKVICTVGESTPTERFRTGTPVPAGGTTALSGYHAWKSLLWPDAEAVAAALAGERVISIGIRCRSAGDGAESAPRCPLRLYRTTLSRDDEKRMCCSADTLRPDAGMTFENPYNAYFAEYGETEPLEKGGSFDNAVFMTGEAAERLAEALAAGCALGTWDLKSGRTFSSSGSPWHVRHLEEPALVIAHEPADTRVSSPLFAAVSPARVTAGGEAALRFSGTGVPSAENPLTGYRISHADRTGEGEWGEWSEGRDTQDIRTEGVLAVAVPAAGVTRKYRIAALGAKNTGDYTPCEGTVTGIAPPEKCEVTGTEALGQAVTFTVRLPAAPAGGCLWLYIGEEMAGMTGPAGGSLRCRRVFTAQAAEAVLTVRDAFGGVSGETRNPICPHRRGGPGTMRFKGLYSEDLGLTVSALPARETVERLEEYRVPGRDGTDYTGEEAFDTAETELNLTGKSEPDSAALAEFTSGAGEAVFGDRPGRMYRMRILRARPERFPGGGFRLTLRAALSPFWEREEEEWLPLTGEETPIWNGGAVRALPLIRLTGTGDLSVTAGEDTLTLYGVEGTAVIDCAEKTVTDAESGEEIENGGNFPSLPRGESRLCTEGEITEAAIRRRERFL